MSTVRLRCPTCRAEVELGREHLGAEVECGACLAVFVADPRAAAAPPPPPPPAERARNPGADTPGSPRPAPSRRPRPRRDYPRRPADPEPPASGAAVASLVLGIMGVLSACLCPCVSIPLAVGAMATGGTALMGRGGHGVATAGLILGVVGLMTSAGAAAFGFGGNLFNMGR